MKTKLASYYGLFIGVMMVAQWGFFILAGQVPEFETEPWRIAMHLAAEFVTAVGLIFSSIAILKKNAWGKNAYLLFSGMLFYSVIISPGYFAQQGQWAFVGMFAIFLILAVLCVFAVIKKD